MLFNKRLLQTYLNNFEYPQGYDFERVEKIIGKWQESIKNGNYDKTNEKKTQVTFLTRFFDNILGYIGMHDSPDEWFLDFEAKTELDGTKADGALGYFTKDEKSNVTRAVIELKDAKTPLDKKQSTRKDYDSPVSQAFSYSSKFDRCDWIIVSNFKEIRLYNKERGQGYFESFEILNLNDEKEFKRFYFLLCKQNLLDKNRNSLLDNLIKDTTKNEEEISKQFYKDFKVLRLELFNHLCEHNPDIDKKCLLGKTQKLLDRMVFVFFCEDTNNLLPQKIVKQVYELGIKSRERSDQRIWREFKNLFIDIDEGRHDITPPINAYNGGLFKEDTTLENLNIKDDIWEKIVKMSDYDFESDLNVNILGHIFEQSLSDLEQIKAEIDGVEEDKTKSKRKKDGIFYTPEYITKYIVEQTVGKYLEENPDKLETIKIIDPACGSGAFLNQAHEFLKKQYEIRTEEKIDSERSIKRGGQEFLQTKLKHINIAENDRSILLNNLYGVDLNEESTEITKLSLWLKTARKDKPLENLDNNIKCGNSLIDDEAIAGDKAFNWNEQFKDIMDDGGFDCIIGNPPYVFTRAQAYEEDLKVYFQNYLLINNITKEQKGKNIQSGKLNLYTWFLIKSIEILNEGGILSFIIPNGILRTTTYDLVRKFILENTRILQIIDMGAGVFDGVTTSTVILILQKSKNIDSCNNNLINIYTDVSDISLRQFNHYQVKQSDFIKNTSFAFNIFVDSTKQCINQKIINNAIYLGEICSYISPGIDGDQEKYVRTIKENEQYKPLLYGKNIGKYIINYNNNFILYDRKLLNRARNEEIYLSEKIVLQRISGGSSPIHACIDKNHFYTFNSVNNIVLKAGVQCNLYFILSLLNSKVLNWYYANNFSNNSNLTVNISKTFLEKLPIANAMPKQQASLADKAEQMIELNKQLHEGVKSALELLEAEYQPKKTSQKLEQFYTLGLYPFMEELQKQGVKLSLSQKEDLMNWYNQKSETLNNIKKQIDTLDYSIDAEVYKIYNLTPEEIKIIDGV